MTKHLSEVLNGAKITNIAKREKVKMNSIYVRIANEVTALNRKHGTNLSTRLRDIKSNRDEYRNALKMSTKNYKFNQPQKTNESPKEPRALYKLLRFTNPLDAINNLEGDMRIGAIIMYNTLNND